MVGYSVRFSAPLSDSIRLSVLRLPGALPLSIVDPSVFPRRAAVSELSSINTPLTVCVPGVGAVRFRTLHVIAHRGAHPLPPSSTPSAPPLPPTRPFAHRLSAASFAVRVANVGDEWG